MRTLFFVCSLPLLMGAVSCQKSDVDPVNTASQRLNGQYSGTITYVTYLWTGKADTLYRKTTGNLNFKLEGNKFHRPECGDCSGTIAIDDIAHTMAFNSPSKACSDKGSDSSGNWSYTNGIMGDYTYSLVGNELTLIQTYSRPKDMGAGSAYNTEKIIVATAQPVREN